MVMITKMTIVVQMAVVHVETKGLKFVKIILRLNRH